MFGFIAIGLKIRRYDIHVVAGTDRLLLLFDLHAVDVRHLRLHHFDGCSLIQRLYMHVDDHVLLCVEEVLQHLIGQLRCQDI